MGLECIISIPGWDYRVERFGVYCLGVKILGLG